MAASSVMADHPRQPSIEPAIRLAWSAGRHVSARQVDLLLRLMPRRPLGAVRARLDAMGLPVQAVDATLDRVRSLDSWSTHWTWAAQRFLADARQARTRDIPLVEGTATRQAALAYGVAAWNPNGGPKELRTLRATSADLFARSLPIVDPGTVRVEIPWRTTTLPGFLVRPPDLGQQAPLVVLLNGLTTSKEELLFWIEPLLWRGLAVLTLDWPGTGEAAAHLPLTADCDDLSHGVIDFATADSALNERRVGIIGISLGGALATRIAATDHRIAAVVAVTPPFDGRTWLPLAGSLLTAHLSTHCGGMERLPWLAEAFALPNLVRGVTSPFLVLGAGRDLVIPPAEAVRLAASSGDATTLYWYPAGSHALFNRIPQWTADVAAWLADQLAPGSTRIDGYVRAVSQIPQSGNPVGSTQNQPDA